MILSDQYKKLHMDDVSRSRILQTVEEADLDTYRDRPEFIQKERPELAEVGDPASLKSRTQSSERPGFRRGMSRSLMNLMTIAAAAALTLLIAVPLIRINSGKEQMSTGTQMIEDTQGSQTEMYQSSAAPETNMQDNGREETPRPYAEAPSAGEENSARGAASAGEENSAKGAASAEEGNSSAEAASPGAENSSVAAASPEAQFSSDSVMNAFRDYYGGDCVVELKEATPETISLTVTRNAENGAKEILTVTVDLFTGEAVTLDEAGSQVETGAVSTDGTYTARS